MSSNTEESSSRQGAVQLMRAAAIQLDAVVGDVAVNVAKVEALVDDAVRKTGARFVAVPEFFTSQLPFDKRVHQAVLPPDNVAVEMLLRLARRHRCWIGGSMLIAEQGAILNRYHLIEPSGRVHLHDKDLPTMWENAFYGPGHDDGVFDTELGGVGAAVCWELIRSATARRLRGRVGVVISGTHWWTLPLNWGAITRAFASVGQYNRYLSENAPAELARRVGAPVVQASHCGRFSTDFMLLPGVDRGLPYLTEFVGCTQIVDASGHVLAQRQAQEGAGFVSADIDIGACAPAVPIEDRFWIPALPLAIRAYWHHQNVCGKAYYRSRGRQAGLASLERLNHER
ncbi:carbon-nitrogen hydrolase family protein [Aquabacterium sp.]|uniref:carbon-nitrogen hydrolase family protein n=1 Tax=Aquabacterium sp. TaxID=1872578 RepID=UPI0035AD8849